MPKDNIERAINKSELNKDINYNSIVYEGFGPEKIAVIVEALTDNKNRTASKIRTIFQKNDGNLGTQGSASHNFNQIGVIKINNLGIFFISMVLFWVLLMSYYLIIVSRVKSYSVTWELFLFLDLLRDFSNSL